MQVANDSVNHGGWAVSRHDGLFRRLAAGEQQWVHDHSNEGSRIHCERLSTEEALRLTR